MQLSLEKNKAVIQSSGHADLRKLARRISESSTVSSTDTLAVLEAFEYEKSVANHILPCARISKGNAIAYP